MVTVTILSDVVCYTSHSSLCNKTVMHITSTGSLNNCVHFALVTGADCGAHERECK